MNDIEKVNDFLTQAGIFYLATTDGDKPKCRPVAFHMLNEGKLYFGVGDFKDVYKQMQKNSNIEFCNFFFRFLYRAYPYRNPFFAAAFDISRGFCRVFPDCF